MAAVAMKIRPYELADREAVLGLVPRLLTGMPPWREEAAWLKTAEGWVAGAIDNPDAAHAVFVAEIPAGQASPEIAGFVDVGRRQHFTGALDAYIGELVVAERFARRGVGRELLRAAEDWARERGYSRITLDTGMRNHPARAFYAAVGFEDEAVTLSKALI